MIENSSSSAETPQAEVPYGQVLFWWNNLVYLIQEQFWILVAVAATIFVLDYAVYHTAARVYVSKGTFIVDQSPFQFTGNQNSADDSRMLLQSIISSVQSEDMREIVAERLNVPAKNVSIIGLDAKVQKLKTTDTVNIDATADKGGRTAVVEADASDPQFAARASNAVLDELSGLNRLTARIDGMNEQIKVVQAKVGKYADAVSGFESDRVALEQKMLGLKQHLAAGGSLESSPAFADDPGLLELVKKRIDADAAYHAQAQVSVRGDQLTALKGQQDNVNHQINSYLHDREIGLNSAYYEAEAKVKALQASLKEQTDLLNDLGSQKATLIKAIGDFKLRRELGIFNDKAPENEAGVIVILDRARPALKPSRPNLILYGAIGCFLILVLAPSLMFLRHNLDQRIRSPLQIEWSAGVHCLAVLSKPPKRSGNKENPHQFEGETFAGLTFLRNQLLRQSIIANQNQIVVFTDLGKSQSSEWVAHLGWLMAQADKPTLLIDLDFQHPSLSRTLNVPEGPGLYEWVKSSSSLSNFVSRTGEPNLGLLQPGKHSSDLDIFLSRRPLAPQLTELSRDWPFIFVYAPPLVKAPNLLLATPPDCPVIALVHYNQAKLSDLREEITQCDAYHFRFAGVVLHHYPLIGSYRNKSRIGSHRYIYDLKNSAVQA